MRQYAECRCEAIATCRDPDKVPDLALLDPGVTVERLDVRSASDLDAVTAQLDDTPIDVLLCNAAVLGGKRCRFGDVESDAWRSIFEVNVLGAVRVDVRPWKNVAPSEERKIVFLASKAGLPREVRANNSYIYASSKAALDSAARVPRARPRRARGYGGDAQPGSRQEQDRRRCTPASSCATTTPSSGCDGQPRYVRLGVGGLPRMSKLDARRDRSARAVGLDLYGDWSVIDDERVAEEGLWIVRRWCGAESSL